MSQTVGFTLGNDRRGQPVLTVTWAEQTVSVPLACMLTETVTQESAQSLLQRLTEVSLSGEQLARLALDDSALERVLGPVEHPLKSRVTLALSLAAAVEAAHEARQPLGDWLRTQWSDLWSGPLVHRSAEEISSVLDGGTSDPLETVGLTGSAEGRQAAWEAVDEHQSSGPYGGHLLSPETTNWVDQIDKLNEQITTNHWPVVIAIWARGQAVDWRWPEQLQRWKVLLAVDLAAPGDHATWQQLFTEVTGRRLATRLYLSSAQPGFADGWQDLAQKKLIHGILWQPAAATSLSQWVADWQVSLDFGLEAGVAATVSGAEAAWLPEVARAVGAAVIWNQPPKGSP